MSFHDWQCFRCNEKLSLLAQIEDLNRTIFDLNERLSSQRRIREEEFELQEVVVMSSDHHSVASSVTTANDTSVWSSSSISDISKISADDTDFSSSNIEEHNSTENDETTHKVLPASTVLKNGEAHISNVCNTSLVSNIHTHPFSNHNLSQASVPGMTFKNSDIDMKKIKTLDQHKSYDPLNKFSRNNNVKTLIIGDSTFSKLLLNTKLMKFDEYFKIAKRGATIGDSINNALYFIHHLLPGITNVIIQVTLADCYGGKSEKVLTELKQFVLLMNEVNIEVVVCGPIPFTSMTNGSFSRALAINRQLVKQKRYGLEKFYFVDMFDLLWNDSYAFAKKRHTLSNYGYWLLEEAVTSCLILVD